MLRPSIGRMKSLHSHFKIPMQISTISSPRDIDIIQPEAEVKGCY
ncbi:hypothetical protein FTUN_5067 [Frigoriglobus tundricola]|uniref:Uncharacterized protein n=1 Tax=Frigoriglobus tundricola TaxID=2774151 RepID=A0A6M5YWA5_9BACT|nr:hypothetical protein FTUN_5067 [Frigoriglobus tundricola]